MLFFARVQLAEKVFMRDFYQSEMIILMSSQNLPGINTRELTFAEK